LAGPAVLLPKNRIDLDQFQGGGIRGCCRPNSASSGWKIDNKPTPPHSPLPGLRYRHAGEQREELAEFDTFECLSCQTVIRESKPQPPGGKC